MDFTPSSFTNEKLYTGELLEGKYFPVEHNHFSIQRTGNVLPCHCVVVFFAATGLNTRAYLDDQNPHVNSMNLYASQ